MCHYDGGMAQSTRHPMTAGTDSGRNRSREAAGWAALGTAVAVCAAILAWGFSVHPVAIWGLGLLSVAAFMGFAWTLGRAEPSELVPHLLLEAARENPEARLITDPDGRGLYANSAFYRLFPGIESEDGQPPSLHSLSHMLNDSSSQAVAGAFARLSSLAKNGVPGESEVPLDENSEVTEWRRISVLPIASGHASGPSRARVHHSHYVLWRAEDITARRQLEAVRRIEEEKLADYLDLLPAGFFSADSEGCIQYANRTLTGWLGVSAGAMRQRSLRFADFVVASSDSQPLGPLHMGGGGETAAGEGGLHGEVTLKAADGTVFRACLMQSEKLTGEGETEYSRSMVLRDMAWKRQGEGGEAPLSDGRVRRLFEDAPVGIVLLNLQGEVTDCNRTFLHYLAKHRSGVVGRPLSEFAVKEDRADMAAQLSKVVMGTMRAAHLEISLPGAGERILNTSVYAGPMADALGEVSGLILHFIDITEYKNLEVQFTQSQKIQAVGQLAGGIAHDFNNLLTAMIGFSDLLLERHGPDDPSFADIMQIQQNANRATNLVRQLLAFSRNQALRPEVLDPAQAMADLSNLLGRLIGETIELKIETGRDSGYIRVDPVQFDQVIINLVVNARDAMPGGGSVVIRTSAVTLDKPVQRGHESMQAGPYVLIEVVDTGVGIAREDIDRIFEPFFTTKDVGEGTGLGLSTVYGIIRQTGGHIFVDSAPGEGTTLGMYLPSHEPPDKTGSAAEALAVRSRPPADDFDGETTDLTGTGTVLLVEDEDPVRMFGARALRNKGYRVLEARNGEGALDVINSNGEPIQLIVSDVVMPGMDGHTLVKLVRHELPDVKVILMSGYAEDRLSDEINRDPTIHFLPKPFTLKALAGLVKRVMEE